MKQVLHVARDLLHEATYRRWLVSLIALITLVALVLVYTLELEVIDGVLAGTRLFGQTLDHGMRTTHSILRPFFIGGGVAIYVIGLLFGILVCSNFAPELLAPGRIEHLLALPIQRWQLILGTYIGVMTVALIGTTYASGIFTLLVGFKTGVWSPALVASGFAACIAFSAIYGVMLMSAVFVRSPGVSAALGVGVLALGVALPRPELAAMFDPGFDRAVFTAAVSWLPRFGEIVLLGLAWGKLQPFAPSMVPAALSALVFGAACLSLAVWEIERRDY